MRKFLILTIVLSPLLVGLFFVLSAQDTTKNLEPIPIVEPAPEGKKVLEKNKLEGLSILTPTPEQKKTLERKGLDQISTFDPQAEARLQYKAQGLEQISTVEGLGQPNYLIKEFNDFSGGLNLSAFKTQLKPNEALELENALINTEGKIYKRRGYSIHSTTPEVFNFVQPYYQQDGDKYIMGGSDTALYFWQEDSADWTYLKGTEGTSGRWDGTTFEDLFIAVHEGITPIVWDGLTFTTLGTVADSFRVIGKGEIVIDDSTRCDSVYYALFFDSEQANWETDEWGGYIVGYWKEFGYWVGGNYDWDTVFRKDIIISNTDHKLDITAGAFHPDPLLDYYAKIYSWFDTDTVWREGRVDTTKKTGVGGSWGCRIIDSSFYWDSTFQYTDYIFEVTSGLGKGKRTFLDNYIGAPVGAMAWDTTGFFLVPYHALCFDSTTHYKIYKVSFWKGSKFVENFDSRLWLAWTGIGEEQEKNRVVWSNVSDLGAWDPENSWYIDKGGGDYITGMAQFFTDQSGYKSLPFHELVFFRNNDIFKGVPSSADVEYSFYRVASGVGCGSNSAIASVEGRYLLFPDQTGVYAYDGNKVQNISLKIKPIFDDWDLANLEDVSAVYNPEDRHYYISYPDTDYVLPAMETFFVSYGMAAPEYKKGLYTHRIYESGAKIGFQSFDVPYYGDYNDIGVDINGNYVLIWVEGFLDSANVFLQRFDNSGNPIGDSIIVNDSLYKTTQFMPTCDMNNYGDIIVAWEDVRNSEIYTDIYGQRLTWSGGKIGSNFVVNTTWETTGGNLFETKHPDVAINDNGLVIITWDEVRQANYLIDIWARRFDKYGNPLESDFRVNDVAIPESIKTDEDPAVCMGSDNRFVITWSTTRGPHTWDIWKQNYDTSGSRIDPWNLMVNTGGNHEDYPEIAMNSNGLYVIAWTSNRDEMENTDIYAQKYNADHSVNGSEFLVNEDIGDTHDELYPSVGINKNSIFLITWNDTRNPNYAIYGQLYDFYGAAIGSNFAINDSISEENCEQSHIKCASIKGDFTLFSTLSWSLDYGGWGRQSFGASAYGYQHRTSDEVKIVFADGLGYVNWYGTQADDVDDPVIMTYQSKYDDFNTPPHYDKELRFATIEASLDTGTIYTYWYKNYGTLIYQDSVEAGGDCLKELYLPDSLQGKNISLKIVTGSETDRFTLSRFWEEYVVDDNRK